MRRSDLRVGMLVERRSGDGDRIEVRPVLVLDTEPWGEQPGDLPAIHRMLWDRWQRDEDSDGVAVAYPMSTGAPRSPHWHDTSWWPDVVPLSLLEPVGTAEVEIAAEAIGENPDAYQAGLSGEPMPRVGWKGKFAYDLGRQLREEQTDG